MDLTTGWAGLLEQPGLALLENALLVWLPNQRWFGAKTRHIKSVHVADWVELPGSGSIKPASALPPAIFYVDVAYTEGASDTYQLPLAVSAGDAAVELEASHPLSMVAMFATTEGSAVLHDGITHEEFRQRLLELIVQNAALPLHTIHNAAAEPAPLSAQPGEAALPSRSEDERTSYAPASREPAACDAAGGRLQAISSPAFDKGREFRPSRMGSAEQSNTSILYGKQLILKLFRRLQPGENPDVEIGRFLTNRTQFRHIAPFMGEISVAPAGGELTTVAMLQGLVANQGDGWKWFLDQLGRYFEAVGHRDGTPPDATAPSFLHERQPPAEATEFAGPALEAAALLGRRTAEMHLALATPTDDPAFAAELMTPADLALEARRIDGEITSTLEALKVKLSTLKDQTADQAGLLLSRRIDLFARAHAITASTAAGQRIRIHGDYHLGQTLRVESASATSPNPQTGDFVLLDFEGEPARSLAERRRKQSPLKDVAGMIRSLSYASYSGLDQYLAIRPDLARSPANEKLSAWAVFWQNSTSTEFLRAYRQTVAANPALLPSEQQAQRLLEAYLLEKALYELLYELNNRPAWLRIPLAGILTL